MDEDILLRGLIKVGDGNGTKMLIYPVIAKI